jgi:hypothetical protein
MDMRFGMWNVRSLYRAGSLMTVVKEISKYKVDLVGVHTGFFMHKRIISAVKRVEFVSDRMSYIILRGHWYDIVLNVHAPTEDKIDDRTDRFYKINFLNII